MKPILKVNGLGKEYVIGALEGAEGTIRAAFTRAMRKPLDALRSPKSEKLWALRDVSFDAMPGDVIGVLGKNGAGKSTLLKILSRITEPSKGRVELYGRVGSLLEVGTGFHQELTGRENVYLNGAILGMRRAEINRKFDEIVAFAEVEKFVETPVKRYSSGMYLRLAFAVAAFLESEILLVDEVLAVGDAAFQKRCLGKMREVSASGRTVLFVSHNMAAIESLCNRCLYIEDGRAEGLGIPHEVIGRYLSAGALPKVSATSLESHPGRRARSELLMRAALLTSDGDTSGAIIRMGSGLSIRVDYRCDERALSPVLGIVIKNNYGVPVFGVNNRLIPGYQFETLTREGSIAIHFNDLPLMPDTYSIDLMFGDPYFDYDVIYDALSFEVLAADVFGNGKLPGAECGPIFWPATWTHTTPTASAAAKAATPAKNDEPALSR